MITISVKVPVYEVSLKDDTLVRFHDYETEDGGLRIRYKKPGKYSFPDRRGSRKKHHAKPDADLTTYRSGLIPFAELDGQCVSPIRIGTVSYKREYEHDRQDRGWIFTSYHHKYRSNGDTYVEFDNETLITTET